MFDKTLGVINSVVNDIKKLANAITIITYCVFFCYYIYSIYNSFNNLPYLVVYSLLFALSIVNFIYYLVTTKNHTKKSFAFTNMMSWGKYVVNAFMICVRIVEFWGTMLNGLDLIFLVVSIVSLITNIIMQVLMIYADLRYRLLEEAVREEAKIFFDIANAKYVKGNFYHLVDAPFEAIANKLENKAQTTSTNAQKLEELRDQFREQRKAKRLARKQMDKQKSNEIADKEKSELKQHLSIIREHMFKKK